MKKTVILSPAAMCLKYHNQDDLDNHSNQLNPNNDEYWHSREKN
jgi:hypothetical protein